MRINNVLKIILEYEEVRLQLSVRDWYRLME